MKTSTAIASRSDNAALANIPFNNGVLWRVITLSTAAAFGFAIASGESLRQGTSGLSFQISTRTFVAFALGSAAVLAYWKIVTRSRRSARGGTLAMIVASVALFLYPLRFVPTSRFPDISVGLITVVCFVSAIGFILFKFKRFFDADATADRQLDD